MYSLILRRFVAIGIVLGLSTLPATGMGAEKKVVCFGDSITKAGYPEVLGKLIPAQVINAGVGGHTTTHGLRRIQKDVLDQKPDVVVVFFGTNDSRLAEPGVHVPLGKYEANLVEIIEKCRGVGAKIVLCTIPPINPEPYFKRHAPENFNKAGGMERVVASYREAALKVGKAQGVAIVDLNEILTKKPEWLAPDGVHPTKAGTQTIAEEIAKAVIPLLMATAQ